MRASLLARPARRRTTTFATDMPYLANNVTLDPTVKDINGQPAPRITYQIGKFEQVSEVFFIPLLHRDVSGLPAHRSSPPLPQTLATSLGGVAPTPTGEHTMGGMQMGVDPTTSVVDAHGRMHQMDNVYVADSSVFTTLRRL